MKDARKLLVRIGIYLVFAAIYWAVLTAIDNAIGITVVGLALMLIAEFIFQTVWSAIGKR